MVPSSCHGVVFAPGNGKCQEMLSLRIVVFVGSSAAETPARSRSRSMSERMVWGATLRTATLDFMNPGVQAAGRARPRRRLRTDGRCEGGQYRGIHSGTAPETEACR